MAEWRVVSSEDEKEERVVIKLERQRLHFPTVKKNGSLMGKWFSKSVLFHLSWYAFSTRTRLRV